MDGANKVQSSEFKVQMNKAVRHSVHTLFELCTLVFELLLKNAHPGVFLRAVAVDCCADFIQ